MIVFTVGDSLPKHFNIFLSLPLDPWPIFSVFDLSMVVFPVPLNPHSIPHSKLLRSLSYRIKLFPNISLFPESHHYCQLDEQQHKCILH